jgi:hypothetical protein
MWSSDIGVLLVLVPLLMSCGGANHEQIARDRAVVPQEAVVLPPLPEDVPAARRVSVAVVECQADVPAGVPPQKVGPGIMLSTDMAARAARVKIAYDEMRALYEIELRAREREREAYQRIVEAADEEADLWRERSERTWFERHGWWLGMGAGVIVGAGTAIGIAAALDSALGD